MSTPTLHRVLSSTVEIVAQRLVLVLNWGSFFQAVSVTKILNHGVRICCLLQGP